MTRHNPAFDMERTSADLTAELEAMVEHCAELKAQLEAERQRRQESESALAKCELDLDDLKEAAECDPQKITIADLAAMQREAGLGADATIADVYFGAIAKRDQRTQAREKMLQKYRAAVPFDATPRAGHRHVLAKNSKKDLQRADGTIDAGKAIDELRAILNAVPQDESCLLVGPSWLVESRVDAFQRFRPGLRAVTYEHAREFLKTSHLVTYSDPIPKGGRPHYDEVEAEAARVLVALHGAVPGCSIHVGRTNPFDGVQSERLGKLGRPPGSSAKGTRRDAEAMRIAQEFAQHCGSDRKAANRLGCSHTAVQGMRNGKGVSAEHLDTMQRYLAANRATR